MSSEVRSLLERRAQITGWLERLEEQRGTVSERAFERVRADYEGRLADALDALREHQDAILRELEGARQRAGGAESRRAEADERLEEGTLRETIGELTPEEWATERAELAAEVEAAARELDAAREEADRLEALLREMEGQEGEATTAAADEDGIAAADAPGPLAGRSASALAPAPAEPSFLFDTPEGPLDESGEGELTIVPAPLAANEEEPSPETAPKPGLKCGECGYTNDLSAWFCGVCGADVG